MSDFSKVQEIVWEFSPGKVQFRTRETYQKMLISRRKEGETFLNTFRFPFSSSILSLTSPNSSIFSSDVTKNASSTVTIPMTYLSFGSSFVDEPPEKSPVRFCDLSVRSEMRISPLEAVVLGTFSLAFVKSRAFSRVPNVRLAEFELANHNNIICNLILKFVFAFKQCEPSI